MLSRFLFLLTDVDIGTRGADKAYEGYSCGWHQRKGERGNLIVDWSLDAEIVARCICTSFVSLSNEFSLH